MLSPDDRTLLADLLQPPPGHRLEHAIATTFTLDMTALLTVPLGFAGSDLVAERNQVALLHAVREYSDRIDVFCQRGMIRVPSKPNALLAFLEEIIHPVGVTRSGTLFHPKIWLLRFSSDSEFDTGHDGHAFRLICGSRNLTFDRSWDAAIVLEGREQKRRFAVNNPLCDLLRSLPVRSGGLGTSRSGRLTDTIDRLSNVEWDRLEGVPGDGQWLQFHVLGRGSTRRVDLSGKRTLIVSPFLNGKGLKRFGDSESLMVISRSDQFDALDQEDRARLAGPESMLFTLDDDAAIRDLEDEDTGLKWELSGLHAKLYAFERGHYTHVMVGSANATDAGWAGNDEFLVEIVGRRSEFGIDTLIGPDSPFRKLLVPHSFGEFMTDDPEADLQRRLEQELRDLASIEFRASISGDEMQGWSQSVSTESPLVTSVPDARISLALVTLPSSGARQLVEGKVAVEWQLAGVEQATPFVTVELECGPVRVSTIVLARLLGGPEDRVDRVLAAQFADKESFLQFVALLLAIAGDDSSIVFESILADAGSSGMWRSDSAGLLEVLLRALSRSPASIDDVARLVERLKSTQVGRTKFPEGWEELWEAVLHARSTLGASR